MTQTNITTAGIDTSKAKLDVAVHGRTERWQVPNTRPGWRLLASHLAKAGVTRIGIEATGGYEHGVVEYLRAADFIVLVLQPMQVKAFGRVHLRRAKNDALDAILIAACTAAMDQPSIEPDTRLARLAGDLTFLEQIEEDIVRFKTRLEHIDEPRLRSLVSSDIRRLKARRTAQILAIDRHLRSHDDLASRLELVLSIPGSAPRWQSSSACLTRPRQPRGSRGSRRPCAIRRRQRKIPRATSHRRRPWPPAPISIRCCASGRLPLEQSPCRTLCAPDSLRKIPQGRAYRLRPKAADLRQYHCPARNAVGRKCRLVFNGCYELRISATPGRVADAGARVGPVK